MTSPSSTASNFLGKQKRLKRLGRRLHLAFAVPSRGRMRHASRTDATMTEVMKALRACGVSCYYSKLPLDLICCVKKETLLVEVKEEGGRLTNAQEEFIASWPGRIELVRGPDDAVRKVLGVEAMK